MDSTDYLVLARKWRPQSWDDMIAQDHVTVTLRNAIQHNRLAHAYLFAGPRGVGKTSAARILAKALNCQNGPTPDPCNQCSSCIEISEGRSMDVFEIDGASNRGINEIRDIRDNVKYAPAGGKYKVYIIDEVHMLTGPAFNALLKTLEEPPAHVVFIFATTEPQKVPATIVSRCQRFDFHRISTHDIYQRLKYICKKENIAADDEALHLIAQKADGSLRDGESLLDQIVSYTEGTITIDHVIKGLGLIDQGLFFEVTDILTSKDIPKGMDMVEKVVSGGYDIKEFLTGLTEHLRNLLIVQSTGSTDLIETSEEYKKRYLEISSNFKEEDILRLIRIVLDTQLIVKKSTNPRFPLELAIVKMIKLDSTVIIEDLLSRLENFGKAKANKNYSSSKREKNSYIEENKSQPELLKEEKTKKRNYTNSSKPENTKEENSLTKEMVEAQWDEIIRRVKKKKITVGSFLREGVFLGLENNTIVIGFGLSNGFHIDAIMRSEKIILEVLKEIFGTDVKFKCIKKDIPPRQIDQSEQEEKADLKMLEESQPIVKKIVDDFDAEIVE